MSNELIQQQLRRLQGLLSADRTGVTLKKAEPHPSAESVGALTAVGYTTDAPAVHVSVYVFSNWNKHREVADKLKASVGSDPKTYARTATNGPMLFFAHTKLEGENARDTEFKLDGIMSAFSGDE